MNEREWPEWLEELRPDEWTSARLRRSVARAAAPLLEARRDDFWDVASRWARLLTPAAAVLALMFAGLAVQQGADGETVAITASAPGASASAPDLVDVLRAEAAPAGFSEFATSDDVVFAALGEAARQRPLPAPRAPIPSGTRP